jgi:hypothetical protein
MPLGGWIGGPDTHADLGGDSVCCTSEDIGIARLGHIFRDGENSVACLAQMLDDRDASGFVYQEAHVGACLCGQCQGEYFFMRQYLRSVYQSRADILLLEAWIFPQDFLLRDPLREHPHDRFHRDARPADHGLAGHDTWVDADSLP